MDKSRLSSLLAWINSTGAGRCLESIEELHDGSHFIELIRRVNGDDNGTSYCETPVQRYRLIEAFVADFYSIKSHHAPFSADDIIKRRSVSDIARLTALMMCACCMGTRNEHFVLCIEKLDLSIQSDIMEIMQHIVLRDEQDDVTLADNFVDILYRPALTNVSQLSQLPFIGPGFVYRGSQYSGGKPATPCFSSVSSASSVFTPSTPMSPVRAFVSSPQVKQKIMARKRHEDFRKIESQLATERALRLDQESEIVEKTDIIGNQNKQLGSFQQEMQKLKKQLAQAEANKGIEVELSQQQEINKRLENRMSELENMKKEVHNLQGVIDRFTEENNQLRTQMNDFDYLKRTNKTMEVKLRENEGEVVHLNTCLQQFKESLQSEQQRSEILKNNYDELQAIYNSKREEFREKLSNQSGDERILKSGESLAIVSEMKQFELEEEIQRLQNNIESITAEREQIKQSASHMEARLGQENKRVSELLTIAKEQCEETKKGMETLQQDLRCKVEEIGKMKVAMQELDNRKTQEMGQMKAEHADLVGRMQTEGRSLQQRLTQQMQDVEMLKNNWKQQEIAKTEEINQMVSAHQHVVENLEQTAKGMKEELTKQVIESERKVEELNGMVAKRTEQIENLMSEHKNQILQFNEEKQELKEKLDSQTQMNEKMTQDQVELMERFQNETSALQKSLQAKEIEASDLNTRLEQVGVEKANLEKQVEVMSKQITEKQLEFSAMEEQKQLEINKLTSDHQEMRTTLEKEVTQVKEELERVRCEYEISQQEMKDLEERMKQQVDQLIAEHQNNLGQMKQNWQNDVVKIDGDKDALKDELRQLEESKMEEVNKLMSSCNEAATRMEERERKHGEEMESRVAEMEKMKVEHQVVENARKQDISQLMTDHSAVVEALRREKEHLAEELKVRTSEIELIKAETIQTGETRNTEINKIMEDHKDTVNRLMSVKANLEGQLNGKERAIKEYQESREQLEAERSWILEESKNLSLKNVDLEQKLNRVTNEAVVEKARLEARIAECEQTIAEAVGQERSTSEEIEQMKIGHQNMLQKMQNERCQLQEELTRQRVVCEELQQKLVQLETSKTSEIKEILTCHEEELAQMKLEKDKHEQNIAIQMGTIKQEIKDLEDAKGQEINELRAQHEVNLKTVEEVKVQEINVLRTQHEENLKSMEDEQKRVKDELEEQMTTVQQMTIDRTNHDKEFEIERCFLLQGKDTELVQLKHDMEKVQTEKGVFENQVVARQTEIEQLRADISQLEEKLTIQSSHGEEILKDRQGEIQNLKLEVGKKNSELEQYQARCGDLEEKTQQQARQMESNAAEVEKLRKNANEWITKKDVEISRSAENSEKMMVAVKEREHVIQDMKQKLHQKDEEIICGMKDRDRLKEENAAMERQLQEHTQAFEQEMKAIQEKLASMVAKQDESSGLEARMKKLSKDRGAVEAKFQRLLASQDKRKKELVQKEKQLQMMSEMRNDASSKAEEMRQENEKMRIDIRTLESKLHQAEEDLRVAKTSHFENFSGVEFVQSMDSINDSLEDALSPDDLNISRASTASDRSASGFSLTLPLGHKLNITVNKSEKKRSGSKSRRNTPSIDDGTPTNLTPTLGNESFMGSFDSLTSFQQPSFSSLRSSRRASLRSGSRNSRRESILPVKVDNTIDELAQSQPNFLRSSVRQSMKSSRQTTARAGFVVVNDCDDEPDLDFDWNRLSELQRRNTLCLPHQRTSYPVEVQMRPPTELSENQLQKGMESPGVITRAQKRRGPEPVDSSTAIKTRIGNQREHMPPPDSMMPPPPVPLQGARRKTTQPMETHIPMQSAETFIPSTNFAPQPTASQEFDRRESIAFSVGFSPKQPKRRGRRPLMSKNSTEKKKAVTPKKSRTPKRRLTPKRGGGTPKRGTPNKVTPKKKKSDGKRRKSFFFGK